jgi:hypothetical protein
MYAERRPYDYEIGKVSNACVLDWIGLDWIGLDWIGLDWIVV